MGPRCSSAETQVCHRSYIIAARGNRSTEAFLNMVFLTTMLTTADVNIHALIAKYGIDIQIVRPEMTKFKMFRVKVNMDFYFRLLARVITGCHYT
jgi:plasmid stability protein